MARGRHMAGSRRKTQWAGFASAAGAATMPVVTVVAAGTTVLLSTGMIVAGAQGLFDEETTVTRTLGRWLAGLTVGTAGITGEFAIGCIVARAEAITAGVASMASPVTDPDAEWLYYASGLVKRQQTADDENGTVTMRESFDVRGQRIVRAGSNVAWLASAVSASVDIGVSGRYLVKLT